MSQTKETREDVAVPPVTCPACSYKMDSATAADGSTVRPKPGDVSRIATRADLLSVPLETIGLLKRTQDLILELAVRRARGN